MYKARIRWICSPIVLSGSLHSLPWYLNVTTWNKAYFLMCILNQYQSCHTPALEFTVSHQMAGNDTTQKSVPRKTIIIYIKGTNNWVVHGNYLKVRRALILQAYNAYIFIYSYLHSHIHTHIISVSTQTTGTATKASYTRTHSSGSKSNYVKGCMVLLPQYYIHTYTLFECPRKLRAPLRKYTYTYIDILKVKDQLKNATKMFETCLFVWMYTYITLKDRKHELKGKTDHNALWH